VREPTDGARRREGLLLGGYAVLFVIGVWTVVVSQLAAPEPAARDTAGVPLPTNKSGSAGK
jgi:hypothetical protein